MSLCKECVKAICPNDAWDATGTYRIKHHIAGDPPTHLKFIDVDPRPNLIKGKLTWERPVDLEDIEEYSIYFSMEKGGKEMSSIFAILDFREVEYEIPMGTEVGLKRYIVMKARNGGGDGKTFSSFLFEDLCAICVKNVKFEDISPRPFYFEGNLEFDAGEQSTLLAYKVFLGAAPGKLLFEKEIATVIVDDSNPLFHYITHIPFTNSHGAKYLLIKSYFSSALDKTKVALRQIEVPGLAKESGAIAWVELVDFQRIDANENEGMRDVLGVG